MQLSIKNPNNYGYCALFFWALGAVLTTHIQSLPLFETLTIIFSVSFLLSAFRLTLQNTWHQIKQPFFLWVIGFLGIYGNDVLYLAAFQHAPAAQADLINYLWPVLVLMLSGILPNERFSKHHLLAAGVGFFGIYILLCSGEQGFERQYLAGYGFAFANACLWTSYMLCARHFKQAPVELIGLYCGLGALCSVFMHLFLREPSVVPHFSELLTLIAMGLTTQGLAYFFWDVAIRRGNFKKLTLLGYASPVLSIVLLIGFGKAQPSFKLALSCLLVTLAGFIGHWPSARLLTKKNS